METEVLDFEEDVVETSRRLPVLVDFWAPWCGPCRALGPVLDRLAAETDDWKLVKVNSDQHPDLTQRYGVRGIPAVKLFHQGEVVAEFTGALPEYAVRQWLQDVLPSEARDLMAEALPLLDAGLADEAKPLLEQALALDPDLPEARVLLAQAVAFDDAGQARQLLDGARPAGASFGSIYEAIVMLQDIGAQQAAGQLPDGPGRTLTEQALIALSEKRFETAAEAILDALQADRYYAGDAPRRLGVALFTLLGPGHDVTRAYRRRFSMLLY